MKTLRINVLFLSLAGLLYFSSCETGGGPSIPLLKGVIVVNEGNFGQGNGSISFYDEEKMTVSNGVVKSANNGQELGSSVQSVTPYGTIGYVVCNATDKIEIINLEDYKYLSNPVTNLTQPRYMIGLGDRGYITCWGPWGNNWDLPDSYVAVMDLVTNEIIDSLDCGSGPEGIIGLGNKIFIANSYDTTVTVINTSSGTRDIISFYGFPQHFKYDANSTLWVSLTSGFGKYPPERVGLQVINPVTNEKETFVQVPNFSGKMALSGDGQTIFLLTSLPWPNTYTEVWTFDTQTKTLGNEALITGENFYGIGVNPTSGKIYVADAAAFQGSGRIIVYDQTGTQLDEQTVGVGPNSFLFK